MTNQNEFYERLLETTHNSMKKFYIYNYDKARFGKKNFFQKINLWLFKCIHIVLRLLKCPFLGMSENYYNYQNTLLNISGFNYLYNLLENEESKQLLIKICAFRILGNNKVKIFDKKNFYGLSKNLYKLRSYEYKSIKSLNWKLDYFDLKEIGYNIKLFIAGPLAVHLGFINEQYAYNMNGVSVKTEKDDYVIDAGACWGDTALYFADRAGENGKVFSFEFIPQNVEILRKNLSLNPALNTQIEIVENPLWSDSQTELYFNDNGPGSSYRGGTQEKGLKFITVSIDDYVEQKSIPKIDFIKMDIEGAELEALKGAINTIKNYKPKLAISLYHKITDFKDIPEFINSLNLGYKFYLSHNTIHMEETVLFAIVE